MTKGQPITQAQLQKIIEPFSPIVCWQVGLFYGSLVYFHMGDKVESQLLDGSQTWIGSANLTLWGDHWKILEQSHDVVNSAEVTRDFAETTLSGLFVGQEFLSMTCDHPNFRFVISFSGGLEIHGCYQEQEKDLDVAPLFLPDGTIISLTKADGLLLSAETNEKITEHWRSKRH